MLEYKIERDSATLSLLPMLSDALMRKTKFKLFSSEVAIKKQYETDCRRWPVNRIVPILISEECICLNKCPLWTNLKLKVRTLNLLILTYILIANTKKIFAIWLGERSTILAVFVLCFQYLYSLTKKEKKLIQHSISVAEN